jgi:predicted O-methyltransferase YrrM
MAGVAATLATRRDPAARAIAAALRDTSLGRASSEERAWMRRVEEHRRRLPGEIVAAAASARGDSAAVEGAAGICALLSLPPVWGGFLFRLVRRLRPASCLELGTGLGVSAAYQAAALEANGAGRLITVDTAEHARSAERGFAELGLDHRAELLIGPPGESLELALGRAAPVDFALLDADHSEEATLRDFAAIVPRLAPRAVVVLDDIAWTPGMRRAWKALRLREEVALAVGLRRLGIVAIGAPQRP